MKGWMAICPTGDSCRSGSPGWSGQEAGSQKKVGGSVGPVARRLIAVGIVLGVLITSPGLASAAAPDNNSQYRASGERPVAGKAERASAPERRSQPAPAVRDKCKCEDLDVRLRFVGYVESQDWVMPDWRILSFGLNYDLQCTNGDPHDCAGEYELKWVSGPANSGAHIRREDRKHVTCTSFDCKGMKGEDIFGVRIRKSALDAGEVTLKIRIRHGCVGSPRNTDLKVVFDKGTFDPGASDMNGNGVRDDKE